jgi:hypothetical protein
VPMRLVDCPKGRTTPVQKPVTTTLHMERGGPRSAGENEPNRRARRPMHEELAILREGQRLLCHAHSAKWLRVTDRAIRRDRKVDRVLRDVHFARRGARSAVGLGEPAHHLIMRLAPPGRARQLGAPSRRDECKPRMCWGSCGTAVHRQG